MKTIKLTTSEQKMLQKVKKELRTDKDATFTSQSRNNDKIEKVAKKYDVDTQVIWDSIKL